VKLPLLIEPDLQALAFLAWSVPLTVLLTLRLAAPDRLRLPGRRAPAPAALAREPSL
jgi:hypothetical protein